MTDHHNNREGLCLFLCLSLSPFKSVIIMMNHFCTYLTNNQGHFVP